MTRKIGAAVVDGLEDAGVNFLFACERGYFKIVLRGIIAAVDAVEFYLRAKVSFHAIGLMFLRIIIKFARNLGLPSGIRSAK